MLRPPVSDAGTAGVRPTGMWKSFKEAGADGGPPATARSAVTTPEECRQACQLPRHPKAAWRRLAGETPAVPVPAVPSPGLGGGLGVGELRQAAAVAVGLDQAAGLGEGGAVVEEAGAVQGAVGEVELHAAAAGDALGLREVGLGAGGVAVGVAEPGAGEQAAGNEFLVTGGAQVVDGALGLGLRPPGPGGGPRAGRRRGRSGLG